MIPDIPGATWREKYEAYLQTPEWGMKRGLVLERVKRTNAGRCEGCGVRTVREVHHKSYEHLFQELLYELAGLCGECHRVVTRYDAQAKIIDRAVERAEKVLAALGGRKAVTA